MPNPFPYSDDNKRYHTWNRHLRQVFGGKICKAALDAGCTCPNAGSGGCAYCTDPGRDRSRLPSLEEQFRKACAVQARKWPAARFLAYFQSGTNTCAPLPLLRERFETALSWPGAVGLCIATRADALEPSTIAYLADLSRRTYLVVELGLQTIHDETARRINRRHTWLEFLKGYRALREAGIQICVHLINGLPGETREMMLESARTVGALRPHSLKLHMLYIVQNTALEREYRARPFPLPDREEYISLICGQLELLPPETVIQRLTGDPVEEALIAPRWVLDKRRVLNGIDKELARRDSWQGKALLPTGGTQ